jgi:hypothetical protein
MGYPTADLLKQKQQHKKKKKKKKKKIHWLCLIPHM